MDGHVLTCWKNGITFNHPDLYFSVEEIESTMPERKAIETKVRFKDLSHVLLSRQKTCHKAEFATVHRQNQFTAMLINISIISIHV